MSIRFDGQVAIVTGAGNGLGKSHALALAERGAKVVVNDFGGSRDGTGGSTEAANAVVQQIIDKGGDAIANGANVADNDQVQQMVKEAVDTCGRVDILINNAGILRDKTFAKMPLEDFDVVMDVHLKGSVNCTKAVWEIMREQQYGRIVMTTSSSGTAGLLTLCHERSPNRFILCAGAGGYAQACVYETDGIYLPPEQQTPEDIFEHWEGICDSDGQVMLQVGGEQSMKFLRKAME